MAQTRIVELAKLIANGVDRVEEYNIQHSAPSQSFEADFVEHNYPEDLVDTKQAVIDACDELQALLAGPAQAWITPHHNFLVAQQFIYRYRITEKFPPGKDTATFQELAQACDLPEAIVRRMLKMAMTSYIFTEPTSGTVAHTAASKFFATNPVVQQWVGTATEELWPAATKVVEALSIYGSSELPEKCAYGLAHQTQESVFDHLARHPDRAARFAGAMSMLNTGEKYDPRHLIENFPWKSLGEATFVDVGGSHGPLAIRLAESFPLLKCVVQDRAEVIADARVPTSLEGRLTFQAHDFFAEQSLSADVYFFRWILHDWSNELAVKILRALVPALRPGARVVVMEYILPEVGQVSRYIERTHRAFDLCMLELQNGQERERGDWAQLFAAADPRFRLKSITQPPQSALGIIEVVWE